MSPCTVRAKLWYEDNITVGLHRLVLCNMRLPKAFRLRSNKARQRNSLSSGSPTVVLSLVEANKFIEA